MFKKLVSLCIAFIFISQIASSQTKELSLSDAVLQQYGTLAPKKPQQLQWVSGVDVLSFIEAENGVQSLFKYNPQNKKKESIVSITALSDLVKPLVGSELKSFTKITWLNDNEFMFRYKQIIFTYNCKNKSIALKGKLIDDTQNLEYDPQYKNFAFTKGNNLLIYEQGATGFTEVNDKDNGKLNGQAVHRHEFGINKGTFWSPNGNFLAYYEMDESMVTDYPLVDMGTTPAKVNNIKYPMAGAESHQVLLQVYSLQTKKNIRIETGQPADQYLTCISWDPTEKFVYIAVLDRAQKHMKFNKYDAQTGKFIQTLFEEISPKYVEPKQAALFIPGKNDHFIWQSERDGYDHLYVYKTDGTLVGQLTKGNWVVLKTLGFDAKGANLFLSGTDTDARDYVLYKADIEKLSTSKITKEKGTHQAQLSPSTKFILDEFSNINTPLHINILNDKGGVVSNYLKAENPLQDFKIGKTEFADIIAKDGRQLHGLMIKPYDFDVNTQYKVFVYVYGGPQLQMVRNMWLGGARLWMHYLANKGYIVFCMDNRGTENRGRDFEQLSHKNLGKIEMEDQLEAAEFLKKLPFVNGEKMAIHGWSFGGFMTTNIMLNAPDVFKVGIAGGPVMDWKFYEIMYTERYMETPQSNADGYEATSLLNKTEKLKGDFLLIHCYNDDVVVPQHSIEFLKKCVDNKKQIDFFLYPGHGHNVLGPDRVHLFEKIITYTEEKLAD